MRRMRTGVVEQVVVVLDVRRVRDDRLEGRGGADLGAWARGGVAAVDLQQDGTRYFDLHHTPDDTLDKVDREQLRQNVAAWTAMLSVVANAPEEIGRVGPAQ